MTMRAINRIIIHCSATPESMDIGVEQIRLWHTAPKPRGNGWRDVGYHYVIKRDGTLEFGRPVHEIGAHVRGHNHDSIGICYVGGMRDGEPFDTMTEHQEMTMIHLVKSLRMVFGPMRLHGHNEFAAKACPSFDVQSKYSWLL